MQLPPGHPLVSELFCHTAGFGMKVTLSYTSVPWTSSTSYTSFTPLQAWPLWESLALHLIQPVAPCSGAGTTQTCPLSQGDATGHCHPSQHGQYHLGCLLGGAGVALQGL